MHHQKICFGSLCGTVLYNFRGIRMNRKGQNVLRAVLCPLQGNVQQFFAVLRLVLRDACVVGQKENNTSIQMNS